MSAIFEVMRHCVSQIGIGNIVGLGEKIVMHFRNRAVSHG